MSADWLIEELLIIAKSSDDEKTKLLALNSALDRVGLGTRSTVEIEGLSKPLAPFEVALQSAIRIVKTVKVRVNDDGTETVIEGDVPTGRRVNRVFSRPTSEPSELSDEPDSDVIEAEIVADEPTPDNVVPISRPPAPQRPAMFSALDLQSGLGPARNRGDRNTPTEFNP